jgi:hypothetical protein
MNILTPTALLIVFALAVVTVNAIVLLKIREMKNELPLILLVIKDVAERKETENV